MKKNVLLATALVVALMIGSCKKDDSTDVKKPSELPKSTIMSQVQEDDGEMVQIPQALENNANASTCVTMLENVNTISSFYSFFDVPDDAVLVSSSEKSTGTWIYKYSYGGYTVYYEFGETADKYTWTMYLETPQMAKSKYVYIEESKTGLSGKIQYYAFTSTVFCTWSWTKDAAGNVNFEYVASTYKITVKANIDGSGSFEVGIGGTVYYEGQWNALGHGSVTYYIGGTQTYTF